MKNWEYILTSNHPFPRRRLPFELPERIVRKKYFLQPVAQLLYPASPRRRNHRMNNFHTVLRWTPRRRQPATPIPIMLLVLHFVLAFNNLLSSFLLLQISTFFWAFLLGYHGPTSKKKFIQCALSHYVYRLNETILILLSFQKKNKNKNYPTYKTVSYIVPVFFYVFSNDIFYFFFFFL